MKEIVIKPGMAKLIFVAGILSVILGIFVFLITGIVDVVGFIHDKVPLPTRVILITITKFVLAVFFIEIGLPSIFLGLMAFIDWKKMRDKMDVDVEVFGKKIKITYLGE